MVRLVIWRPTTKFEKRKLYRTFLTLVLPNQYDCKQDGTIRSSPWLSELALLLLYPSADAAITIVFTLILYLSFAKEVTKLFRS